MIVQKFFSKPIVSLIGNTVASSGELLAYALKELDNVTMIGDSTFGPDALSYGMGKQYFL